MSTREWMETPSIDLETKYGPVRLNVVQGDYVYVDASSDGKFLTVSGKRYAFSVRLRTADGGKTWDLAGRQHEAVYSSPKDAVSIHAVMPPSYQKKVITEVMAVVTAYLNVHSHLLAQAALADANNELLRAEDRLQELQGLLANQQAVTDEAKARYDRAAAAFKA